MSEDVSINISSPGPPIAPQKRRVVIHACRHLLPPLHVVELLTQSGVPLGADIQEWFVKECIDDPLSNLFGRSVQYERKLLRAFITAIEAENGEIIEELMLAFSQRLVTYSTDLPGDVLWSYKLYSYNSCPIYNNNEDESSLEALEKRIILSNIPSTLHSKGETGVAGNLALLVSSNLLAGSTGCADWEAGFYLTEYVLNHPELFRKKRCIELGCGVGMVGVGLARAGAKVVYCTDGNMETIANCARNLQVNGCRMDDTEDRDNDKTSRVEVKQLCWEDGLQNAFGNNCPSFDVILGADLLYDPDNIPLLLRLIDQLFKATDNREIAAFIATTRRNEATVQRWLDEVEAAKEVLILEDITKMATTASARGVRFQHVKVLDDARDRILLHKLTPAP